MQTETLLVPVESWRIVVYNHLDMLHISDCDDSNALINPDGIEICNGLDDNCDGTADIGHLGLDELCVADSCLDILQHPTQQIGEYYINFPSGIEPTEPDMGSFGWMDTSLYGQGSPRPYGRCSKRTLWNLGSDFGWIWHHLRVDQQHFYTICATFKFGSSLIISLWTRTILASGWVQILDKHFQHPIYMPILTTTRPSMVVPVGESRLAWKFMILVCTCPPFKTVISQFYLTVGSTLNQGLDESFDLMMSMFGCADMRLMCWWGCCLWLLEDRCFVKAQHRIGGFDRRFSTADDCDDFDASVYPIDRVLRRH